MKSVLLSFMGICFLGSSFAIAAESDLCRGERCTEEMQAIQDEFDQGTNFSPLEIDSPAFYSGSCFHQMSNMNPKIEHHGAFTLWSNEEEHMQFNGLFYFFGSKNPYEHLTAEEGSKLIRSRNERPRDVQIESTMGHVVILDKNSKIDYWMKTNLKTNEMTLLSLWVTDTGGSKSFCQLRRH